MPTILALDTSTSACSVALLRGDEVVEDFVVAPQGHTQRLLPTVDSLLSKAGVSLAELDAIAFASGPGSFTGLRICLGTVQGLAYGADVPVIGVSTLEIMAASAIRLLNLSLGAVIVPALDARMSEVYWGCYQVVEDNSVLVPQCLIADRVSEPVALGAGQFPDEKLLQNSDGLANVRENRIGVGDGWSCVEYAESEATRIHSDFYPHAYDLALLAPSYIEKGKAVSVFDAKPTYIRNEVSWKKRQRIRS